MIKTTNEADHICEGLTCDIDVAEDTTGDPSFVLVQVNNKNVNFPTDFTFIPKCEVVGIMMKKQWKLQPSVSDSGKM